ncbi:hypothetical protein AK812_SmicGene44358 [Symbiodinium microadriaticum]|uniref:Uncharacterized protein n=1 Tax=Symbiodinium microadriaticum TaxID=2951 RepID=A0A1Q9BYP2_SYMMI|nr:hypothetical protein AK812_SmicGene44358 [Symbiodinium microadriaticum]
MLQRCTCANYQTTRQAYADRQVVMLQDIMNTCTFCEPHTQFINGTCQKCPPYNAWSDGKSDVCHVLPQDSAQVGALFAASASCVFLAFVLYQILHAPLVIVDAKSQRIPHRLRKAAGPCKAFPEGMEQRSFAMSLQGPIVDLPQFLSRQLYRQLCYRVKGTGLQWLDFGPENAQAVKIQSIDRSKLEVRDAHVPYDCAAAVGALHATNLMHLMLPLCAALFLVVLLPVALQVASMSGNGIAHVLVTSAYCALPVGLAALILHPVVAWLIERHCRRTPFSKLLDDYRWRIQCDPHPGPDAVHPSNQGFMVLTLWELWGHFESFILDRNMHFVVNNIVRMDVSYWICSFANNQWNLQVAFLVRKKGRGLELGETIMDSAFAQTLRGGIKGVAMVLDHEVQPLTRVWCLFEFLLSKQLELELVFATDVGVIGDDGCTSFDIALELGNKIESLQVANCYASSDGDRTRIFDFIVSSLGSLESMDDQIRDLMGQMLEKNLANVGFATSSLLQRPTSGNRIANWSSGMTFAAISYRWAEPSLLLGDGLVTLQTEGSLRITGNLRVRLLVAELVGVVAWLLVATLCHCSEVCKASACAHVLCEDVALVEASLLKVAGSMAEQDGGVFEEAPKSLWRRHRRHEVEASSQVVRLGETIMDSAFARTLRGGIKGVAMVLDHEVQPLTRVWCLFEFLLSKQLELELVFATDVGVIGDDGCTSFDIALELGKKIESLQVANCYASSDGDRTDG